MHKLEFIKDILKLIFLIIIFSILLGSFVRFAIFLFLGN